jgi:hypothetical protein
VDEILHRLLCEVIVQDNVKIVTLRSTYKLENECMYPLEVILVDEQNKPAYALQKIGANYLASQYPGLSPIDAKQSYSLPIEAVTRNRIKIRPDGMEPVLCEAAFTHLVSWFRFWMEHGKLQLDGFHSATQPYSNLSLSRGRECTISLSSLG